MKKNFHFITYYDFVAKLELYAKEKFCLEYKQNPFIKKLKSLHADDIKRVIQEYSQFSNEAIHMLLDASIRVDWKKLKKEIDRNIAEEKGSQTNGVPHLEIMRIGYKSTFDFDPNLYYAGNSTVNFLQDMTANFRYKNNAFIAGAILALESTSIPEFNVLDALVNRYAGLTNTKISPLLTDYIEGHKNFELEHKDGLLKAIEPYIKEEISRDFKDGYLTVCKDMSNWWRNLALEMGL